MAKRPRFLVLAALTAIAAAMLALFGLDALSTPRLPLVAKNGIVTQLPTGDTLTGSGLIPLPTGCGSGSAIQTFDASGSATCISAGGGGGSGTVTSVACGTGLSCSPSPITGAGTASLSINGGSTQGCGAGSAATSITGAGIWSCSGFGNVTASFFTIGRSVVATGTFALATGSWTDSGTALSTSATVAVNNTLTADSGNRVYDTQGTGLQRDGTNANQLDLNLAGASCSTNTVMTALGATGTGTCAAPPNVTSSTAGYAPSSGGGTTNFLRADATWAAPAGLLSGGTSGDTPVWTSATSLGNGTTTDNGTTFQVGNAAGTLTQDSSTTGSVNNYSLGATTTELEFTNNTSSTLTGITGGVTGRLLYVGYGGTGTLTFSNESASSTAANRIHCPSNANCILNANGGGLWLIYDDTLARWRPVFSTTLPILTVSGAAALSGTTTAARMTVNGSSGNNSLTANQGWTAQTSSLSAALVSNSGTFNTTSGALTAYGVNSTVSATRSSGGNNLTNLAGYFTASGGQVNQALVADAGDVILNSSSGTTTIGGHVITNGTAPTLSSCGTSPSIDSGSTDTAGKITEGDTSTTSCTLTFATAYASAPYCVCSNAGTVGTAATLTRCVTTTTTLVFSDNIGDTDGTFMYMCMGHN